LSDNLPRISIGLAVRNARALVGHCIESILQQDFGDFEIVVCDNVSNDGTVELLETYARADRRIRVNVNQADIGSHENMNRVLRLSRGDLFRWISHDDWLEPGYLSACVHALDTSADAIGVTTGFTLYSPSGETRYEDYRGEFPISPDASRRFERMLWFFHAGDAKYDPIYGVYRRARLMETGLLRRSERTDWLLAAELALKGPIVHLADRLANRTSTSFVGRDRVAFRRRLDPVRSEELKTSPGRTYRDLLNIAASADIDKAQLHSCRRALRRFWAEDMVGTARATLADARYRLLGR
jgi:glycosyltransferase involved in cell wall biosynthesis